MQSRVFNLKVSAANPEFVLRYYGHAPKLLFQPLCLKPYKRQTLNPAQTSRSESKLCMPPQARSRAYTQGPAFKEPEGETKCAVSKEKFDAFVACFFKVALNVLY